MQSNSKKKIPFVSLTFPRLWRIFSHVRNLYSKDSYNRKKKEIKVLNEITSACVKRIYYDYFSSAWGFPSASVKGNRYSEFVHKPWHIHAVEYYCNIKGKKY